jgi:hypothetical protein
VVFLAEAVLNAVVAVATVGVVKDSPATVGAGPTDNTGAAERPRIETRMVVFGGRAYIMIQKCVAKK